MHLRTSDIGSFEREQIKEASIKYEENKLYRFCFIDNMTMLM